MRYRKPDGDHPRMCGEHDRHAAERVDEPGSSPHVRGARRRSTRDDSKEGIIPACAGSTWYPPAESANPRDHPRMCGEHSPVNVAVSGTGGSSPHVRGAQMKLNFDSESGGIIPACAGSTGTSLSIGGTSRDHPRMCGEHATVDVPPTDGTGSSPHVRGALAKHPPLRLGHGIIPACAGSTGSRP